jgi:hypothetical protein
LLFSKGIPAGGRVSEPNGRAGLHAVFIMRKKRFEQPASLLDRRREASAQRGELAEDQALLFLLETGSTTHDIGNLG